MLMRSLLMLSFVILCTSINNSINQSGDNEGGDDDDHMAPSTPSSAKKKHHHHHWGYKNDGDNEWTKESKKCGGVRQSPINIERSKVKYMREFHGIFFNFHTRHGRAVLVNNGHSASITPDDQSELIWEYLENPYTVFNIHFHWGKYDGEGSEHRLDGRPYPLEMHIVTYNSERYSTISDALGHKDSLAVYGVLFELLESDNVNLAPIVNALANVSESKEKIHINGLNLEDLLPSNYGTKYLTYSGSLTTPPCSESVVWILGDHKLFVSSKQLKEFRKLSTNPRSKLRAAAIHEDDDTSNHGNNDKIDFNWRRPQDINKRVVHASFPQRLEELEWKALEQRDHSNDGGQLRGPDFLFLFMAFVIIVQIKGMSALVVMTGGQSN